MRVNGPAVQVADCLAREERLRHVGVAVEDCALLQEALDERRIGLRDAPGPADVAEVHLFAFDIDLVLERDRESTVDTVRSQ